jgi:DNA-binding GntR family transcriptional regulator
LLDEARLKEIYVLRIALEGLAAERGAPHLDMADINRLERTQAELVAAMDRDDYKNVLVHNGEFHFTLYNASGVDLLVQSIEQLWLKLGPSLNLLYPAYNHSRKGVSNHMEILSALRRGDAAAVRQAVERDLGDGVAELSRALQDAYAAGRIAPKAG